MENKMTKEEIRAYNEANMANAMKETAESFGLKLEEEFKVDNFRGNFYKFKFTKNGLKVWSEDKQEWENEIFYRELYIGLTNRRFKIIRGRWTWEIK